MSTGTEDAEAMRELTKAIEKLSAGLDIGNLHPDMYFMFMTLAEIARRQTSSSWYTANVLAEAASPEIRRAIVQTYNSYASLGQNAADLWLGIKY